MNNHIPKPLPSAEDLPYGLVRVTIWKKDEDQENRWSGRGYLSTSQGWKSVKYPQDTIPSGTVVDWSLDGFNLDYFNRGYILDSEAPELVKLAMWALERWSQDVGINSRKDTYRLFSVPQLSSGEEIVIPFGNY